MSEAKERQPDLIRWGWLGTAAWLAVILGWSLWPCLGGACERLPLSDLGDFLSGIFAPLAFLWFVIAVFLQREELRQNSEALRLQTKELEALVRDAQEQTAHNQWRQQTETRRAQPNLIFAPRLSDGRRWEWTVINRGGDALHVEVVRKRPEDLNLVFRREGYMIPFGESVSIGLNQSENNPFVRIRFTNTQAQVWEQEYAMNQEKTAWPMISEERVS